VAQGVHPEFKPQYHKHTQKNPTYNTISDKLKIKDFLCARMWDTNACRNSGDPRGFRKIKRL
jgi:glutamine amidotransferase-like uncharacterized protein